MSKRQNLRYSLIATLSEQLTPITASNLAKKLDVSLRTVKYCVSDINDLAGEKIIHSDKNGYFIVKKATMKEKFRSAKPITDENERYYRIIKEVILEQRKISITQLADIMMISESLARKTIRKINTRAIEFNVQFYVSDGVICISGNEVKIRKLVSTIIFEETSQKFSLRESLEDIFGRVNLFKVKDIIKQFTNKNINRYNDYSIYNFTVHVLIIIERVKNGCFLPVINSSESDYKKHGSFIEEVESELAIIFPESEKKTICLLLDAYFGVLNQRIINDEQIAENSEWFDLANDIAERTESHFMISLRSDTFISLFSAHLRSLNHRENENRKQYNTMKIDLRNNCKVIFDISIYIAFQLASIKGWIINEDEVSFIALHIGSELERQRERDNESSEKLSCAIFCPKYYDLSQQVETQLVRDFAKRINVVINTSELNVLNKNHYDLVITTEKIELVHACELIKIPPFGIDKYSPHIAQKITQIEHEKKKIFLKDNVGDFFSKELFLADEECSNSKEAIIRLANRMLNNGIVNETFLSSVFARENASSTAFGIVALPHSIHMDAAKTAVAMMVNPLGIDWNERNDVKIVIMIAINKYERVLYQDFYNSLVELFSDEKVLNSISKIKTISEFFDIVSNEY